jgi:hypothetical protein
MSAVPPTSDPYGDPHTAPEALASRASLLVNEASGSHRT